MNYGISVNPIRRYIESLKRIDRIGQAWSENLLRNGGFDEGDAVDPVTFEYPDPARAGAPGWVLPYWFKVDARPPQAPAGQKVLLAGAGWLPIDAKDVHADAIQVVRADPGDRFLMSGSMYRLCSVGYALLSVSFYTQARQLISEPMGPKIDLTTPLEQWVRKEWQVVAPANTYYVTVNLGVRWIAYNTGFWCFDNISLVKEVALPPEAVPSPEIEAEITTLTSERNTLKTTLEAEVAVLANLQQQLKITPTPEQAKALTELKTEVANLQARLTTVKGDIAKLKAELARRGVVLGYRRR